ncbi:MAG TPA: FxsA family protein [Polyangiaceae bacterium]|nr:FxsA family protein [Polyangiaceae bacterium]
MHWVRWLAASFLLLVFAELWLLVHLGSWLGFEVVLGLVLVSAVGGAWLAKREGLRVLRSWHRATVELRAPDEGLTAGGLVLAGAVLLFVPGVISDVLGLLLLLPPSRRLVAHALERRLAGHFVGGHRSVILRVIPHSRAPSQGRVIDVEGRALDEPPNTDRHSSAPSTP